MKENLSAVPARILSSFVFHRVLSCSIKNNNNWKLRKIITFSIFYSRKIKIINPDWLVQLSLSLYIYISISLALCILYGELVTHLEKIWSTVQINKIFIFWKKTYQLYLCASYRPSCSTVYSRALLKIIIIENWEKSLLLVYFILEK